MVLQWACANGCPRDVLELHIAAEKGHEAMVRALIESGADVNTANNDDATPLYIAAQEGHEAMVRVLIELGADVSKTTDDDWTALYIAA